MSRSFDPTHGARPAAGGGVEFRVWAPNPGRVSVRVHCANGSVERLLARSDDGFLAAHVEGVAPGDDYVFVLGDHCERPDPASRWQPRGVGGRSRVVDADAWSWTDAHWRGVEIADLVLYEIHVGTLTPQGTFAAAIDELPRLRRLGVTAIELMPIGEFPGARNWGYDGVFAWAPQSTYGGPQGLQQLVDAAHAEGLAVFLDVVYNHVGSEGNVLHEFGPYFTDRYRTPWGDDINFDGEGSDFVRSYFVENARTVGLVLEAGGANALFAAWNLDDEAHSVACWVFGHRASHPLLATDDVRYGGPTARSGSVTTDSPWTVPAEAAMLWLIEEGS